MVATTGKRNVTGVVRIPASQWGGLAYPSRDLSTEQQLWTYVSGMLLTHHSHSIHQFPISNELLSLELVKFKFSVSVLRILHNLINKRFQYK
jgi:hypothetical protein